MLCLGVAFIATFQVHFMHLTHQGYIVDLHFCSLELIDVLGMRLH